MWSGFTEEVIPALKMKMWYSKYSYFDVFSVNIYCFEFEVKLASVQNELVKLRGYVVTLFKVYLYGMSQTGMFKNTIFLKKALQIC